MKSSRRNFLKIAGVSAIGAGMKPAADLLAASGGQAETYQHVENEEALSAKQWAMVVDMRKIHGAEDIEKITSACHRIHNVPEFQSKNHEIKWIWPEEFKHAFPSKSHEFMSERIAHMIFPVLCNHCENPPCVRACPTKATFKRNDGIVLMDFHRCIGCRFCMAACPYGSRSFNFRDPRPFIAETDVGFPTRMKGVVEKCNFCAERLAVGKMPACVEASDGALVFGDLRDPDSEVRELLAENHVIRRKETLGTKPQVYYII